MSKGEEKPPEQRAEIQGGREAAPPPGTKEAKGEEEEEIEVAEERIYTVPLRQAWYGPRGFRAPRAVRLVKAFVKRHMKPEEDEIVMGEKINEALWSKGIQKPPRKIKVRAVKDKEGKVYIFPVK